MPSNGAANGKEFVNGKWAQSASSKNVD